MERTRGKKALVSGASRGIGRAIAEELAKAGYDLYLTCKNSEEVLLAWKEELERKYGIAVHPSVCDMGNYEEVRALFANIDRLDILVNNAGIAHIGLLSDMTVEEWQRIMDVNLNSVFYTCKFAVPLMLREHAGKIVNISSVWGKEGASMEVAYSASKGGVNSFTKALAKELAPSHITVNAVACGVIDTDMNRCFGEEEANALKEEIPADRFGRPEEVAVLVRQMIEAPEYMTGQIITMDGGWYS